MTHLQHAPVSSLGAHHGGGYVPPVKRDRTGDVHDARVPWDAFLRARLARAVDAARLPAVPLAEMGFSAREIALLDQYPPTVREGVIARLRPDREATS